ncbi:hypothetical protein DSM112329_00155 [Paraconexibacter sp. AEG42_29]|uniref:Uncharacterized protein n=1 Tax=Paraconexibacter sp. AEG42_29 TaxID=2997339 RepID=A0AAU7ANX2_9ACTN
MSPIPSDPYDRKPFSLTTKDGKKITLRAGGLEGPPQVEGTVQRNEESAPAAGDEEQRDED